ncbi:MAG: hypothetical protein J6Q30_02375 [Oscillospiraceae bacterium]|nr:hypothetical protein [Oscillospiraceae bacterium]
MAKSKQTKKALLSSVIALILCFSMLLGTTFAWFTDSVESGVNTILAGNLDVELDYYDPADDKWKSVQGAESLFSSNLWEPGHTEVVYLKLSNQGSLAFKYQLAVNVTEETVGINVANKPFKLSDYIYMGVVEGAEPSYTSREEAVAAAKNGANGIIGEGYSKSGTMLKDANDLYLAVVVYMPESVGNDANYKTGTNAPVINMGIKLFATQQMNENDSFGNDYDKNVGWAGAANTDWYKADQDVFTLTSPEELAGLAELVNAGNNFYGKTVKLGADMDLNNFNWTPIGKKGSTFNGTFIGTGYTISNLKSIGSKNVGLFGATYVGAHIEGVTVVNAEVSGNDYVGVIVGGGYLAANCIKNCVVENATVTATPYFDTAKNAYDGGAKAGGIVGQAYNGSIIGCTVKNATIIAYRDLGGIAGMHDFDGKAGSTVEASGNTVENVSLSYLNISGKYDDGKTPNNNMNAVVGRVGADASVADDNIIINVTTNDKATMIFTLEELINFAKAVNAGNTYKGKTVILGADIDLANMEWTPIGNSTYSFQGIFDGNGKTISNLNVNMPGKSNAGLFGMTTDGEIKNLTIENAKVTGRLNVGVVAGTPYTSKYTNITVKGHVEVNGMAYVGGVGGKNAYADWTNVTVAVDATSYVNANSVENGTAYRTYVGGVVGFNGEGGHTFKNITSNIDVIGNVCDIGGVFGMAHYNNKFENITSTGDVTNLVSADIDGDDAATDVLETGLIAGVWHNENGTKVEFTNISAAGSIFTPNVDSAEDFHNKGLVGKAYSASSTGELYINGECVWPEADQWDGTADTSWYNETETTFTLATAEQFAGFAVLVAKDSDNFAGKTLVLANDIDLKLRDANGELVSFAPIGSTGERDDRNRLVVEPFKGTFDGDGHTISNLYQSGWAFGYEWGQYGSIGLFSELESATVKNVVIEGFDCCVEGGDISFIAGSATGNCTFENITINSGSIGTYNNGIGGIIGWSGAGTYNFKNITLGEDVVIGGLWGSFDSSVGGIVGQAEPGATYNFENVKIACRLDVYNDCTASYDYYNYRMCGMIIGRLEETTTIDGVNYPDTSKYNITCKDVTVTYGDWANYHYCEPTPANMNGGRGMRVEPGYAYDGLPADYDHSQCVDNHMNLIPFDQIFGGDQLGVKGLKTYNGVTVIYNNH